MTLEPLLTSPLAVQAHVAAVTGAFVAGTWLIYFSRKGAPGHRALGVAFLGLMTAASVAALFIRVDPRRAIAFGLSGTHLLVPFVLVMVWLSLRSAQKGDIRMHRFCVKGLYMGGLVVNILINLILLHGVIHQAVFPAPPALQARLDPPPAIRVVHNIVEELRQ